jgi:hypothetical protein
LNLSSESWFTSKLFIFSSKEPTSWGDTEGKNRAGNWGSWDREAEKNSQLLSLREHQYLPLTYRWGYSP